MRKAWRGIVRLGMRVSGFAVRARTGEKYRVISKTHLFIAIRYIQSDKKKLDGLIKLSRKANLRIYLVFY